MNGGLSGHFEGCSQGLEKSRTDKSSWEFPAFVINQATPGDEWDYDAIEQLVLADLDIRRTRRQVVMQADTNGFLGTLILCEQRSRCIPAHPERAVNCDSFSRWPR